MVTELGRVPLGDVKREEKKDMLLEAYLAGVLVFEPTHHCGGNSYPVTKG